MAHVIIQTCSWFMFLAANFVLLSNTSPSSWPWSLTLSLFFISFPLNLVTFSVSSLTTVITALDQESKRTLTHQQVLGSSNRIVEKLHNVKNQNEVKDEERSLFTLITGQVRSRAQVGLSPNQADHRSEKSFHHSRTRRSTSPTCVKPEWCQVAWAVASR